MYVCMYVCMCVCLLYYVTGGPKLNVVKITDGNTLGGICIMYRPTCPNKPYCPLNTTSRYFNTWNHSLSLKFKRHV